MNRKKMDQVNAKIGSIIGADMVLEGNIKATQAVRVEGTIAGDVSSTDALIISSTGKITGNVRGRHIMVAGSVEGDLYSDDRTEIASSGRVIGNVTTKSLIVDANAVFEGLCKMNPDTHGKNSKPEGPDSDKKDGKSNHPDNK